jgi:hypothetical protein
METDATAYIVSIVALCFNAYFIFYEVLQMLVQRGDYFKDILNLFDMARIAAIYFFIMSKQFGGKAPEWIVPVMFFLVWIKIF